MGSPDPGKTHGISPDPDNSMVIGGSVDPSGRNGLGSCTSIRPNRVTVGNLEASILVAIVGNTGMEINLTSGCSRTQIWCSAVSGPSFCNKRQVS